MKQISSEAERLAHIGSKTAQNASVANGKSGLKNAASPEHLTWPASTQRQHRTIPSHRWHKRLNQDIIETIDDDSVLRYAMAIDLQQRTPRHGHRQRYTRTEAINGRVGLLGGPIKRIRTTHISESTR